MDFWQFNLTGIEVACLNKLLMLLLVLLTGWALPGDKSIPPEKMHFGSNHSGALHWGVIPCKPSCQLLRLNIGSIGNYHFTCLSKWTLGQQLQYFSPCSVLCMFSHLNKNVTSSNPFEPNSWHMVCLSESAPQWFTSGTPGNSPEVDYKTE